MDGQTFYYVRCRGTFVFNNEATTYAKHNFYLNIDNFSELWLNLWETILTNFTVLITTKKG